MSGGGRQGLAHHLGFRGCLSRFSGGFIDPAAGNECLTGETDRSSGQAGRVVPSLTIVRRWGHNVAAFRNSWVVRCRIAGRMLTIGSGFVATTRVRKNPFLFQQLRIHGQFQFG